MIPDIHKTVIVTGGSQGIGAGLVKAFLGRCYNMVATSRSITKTGGFETSEKLELVDGSIADPATATRIVEAAKRQFGAIDALVNNVMHENMSSTSAIACARVSNRFGVGLIF